MSDTKKDAVSLIDLLANDPVFSGAHPPERSEEG